MSLTDGELYDFVIAVDYLGEPRAIEVPDDFHKYDYWDQDNLATPCQFPGLPTQPGVYRVIARFRLDSGPAWEFPVVQYERMYLRPSGESVSMSIRFDG